MIKKFDYSEEKPCKYYFRALQCFLSVFLEICIRYIQKY